MFKLFKGTMTKTLSLLLKIGVGIRTVGDSSWASWGERVSIYIDESEKATAEKVKVFLAHEDQFGAEHQVEVKDLERKWLYLSAVVCEAKEKFSVTDMDKDREGSVPEGSRSS